jgi:hypothetical protein
MSVSCFEIARRDANVDLLFLVVVGSAGCHFGFVYDALGKAFFSKWAVGGFFSVAHRRVVVSAKFLQNFTVL